MDIDFTNDLEEFDSWQSEIASFDADFSEWEREIELESLLETFDVGAGEDYRFQSSGI